MLLAILDFILFKKCCRICNFISKILVESNFGLQTNVLCRNRSSIQWYSTVLLLESDIYIQRNISWLMLLGSAVVEHPSMAREVPGSIPGVGSYQIL